MGRIRRTARVAEERKPSPNAAARDTQSVDAVRQAGPGRGRDPNKQVTGRKRHVTARPLGFLLALVVHPFPEMSEAMVSQDGDDSLDDPPCRMIR